MSGNLNVFINGVKKRKRETERARSGQRRLIGEQMGQECASDCVSEKQEESRKERRVRERRRRRRV